MRLLAATRTSMFGWRAWKRARRGTSHSAEMPMLAVTVTGRGPRGRSVSASAAYSASQASAARARRAPSAVSARLRTPRTNSATPSASSSACTWRLIADWVRNSSSAARVKLRCRAAATKPRSGSSGGRRAGAVRMIFTHPIDAHYPFVCV
ncbi:hypothetical protein SAMN05421829_101305 [Aromatoleum tolulyticum]|uniref:Uncharacterized protein n=1 Tax=Aromatoleum tolulyticum TaxID=34027 RepID=A0A1N6NHD9_9RHOO|nr:hypothetical protein SAMN05421829_101305 [Aromatoleum tolulyticum]